ncbi:MAG: shikimate kinase [Oscillospiraceae bacterium]|nr:shikimate kinase [Oscillospiraceae bacterium]MBR7085702.1 shikimate kinase [Oscillospiraceae bacterium]
MTIFLCGFMGCGKSTIGEKLAQKLNCHFIDMDNYIEQKAGLRIPEIFEQFGEPHFRDLETQAVKELSGQEGVIACGGGAMLREVNAQIAREHGVVVLLDVPFRTCYYRIADSDRPIVKKNSRQQLEELYQKRAVIYQQHADYQIDASHSPTAAVSEILITLGIECKER